MENVANNIEVHNSFMKSKTQMMIEKLNLVKAKLNGDISQE